jgi:hypothetical protein
MVSLFNKHINEASCDNAKRIPRLLPPAYPKFSPACKITISGYAAVITDTESSVDPLSTTIIIVLEYAILFIDSRHTSVSAALFQFSTMIATTTDTLRIFYMCTKEWLSDLNDVERSWTRTIAC